MRKMLYTCDECGVEVVPRREMEKQMAGQKFRYKIEINLHRVLGSGGQEVGDLCDRCLSLHIPTPTAQEPKP